MTQHKIIQRKRRLETHLHIKLLVLMLLCRSKDIPIKIFRFTPYYP